MIYRFIELLSRFSLWIFFRRIEVHGMQKMQGPVLYASNHPNMLLDALLLGITCKRKVHFLAKSTLFKNRIVGWILRQCGVIPVYRAKDNPGKMQQNRQAFVACYETLERGEVIGIFPEGVSHAQSYIMDLKTGIARIALEAEARNKFSLGVKIVPLGLNFCNREKFRSSVFVVYGKPIELRDYIAKYQKDSQECVRQLTGRVQKEMESLTVNIKNKEDAEFVKKMESIYRRKFWSTNAPMKKSNRFMRSLIFKQVLANTFEYFQQKKPEKALMLRKVVDNYLQIVEKSKLPVTNRDLTTAQTFVYCLRKLPLLLVLMPIALYGFVNHLCAFLLARILASRSKYLEEIATIKLVAGVVMVPLFYLLQASIACWYSYSWAVLYLISLPIAGLLTLKFIENAHLFFRSARICMTLMSNRALKDKLLRRKKLIHGAIYTLLQDRLQQAPIVLAQKNCVKKHSQPHAIDGVAQGV